MELIADILLVAGALGAGLYCFILARRLRRFTDLEKGVGGAVSVLSAQAEELRKSLDDARQASDDSGIALQALTERAETVAQRLELMMASMHDVVQEEAADLDKAEETPQDTPLEIPEEGVTEPSVEPTQTTLEQPQKKPEGLMFFRHAATSGGAAQ
ncbi:hypothetical protein SAMN05444358_104181 [Ruegeria halocynthiae]|uniref:Uncharacterized protein n=1 Tax=Ruegeria halocynthiae TaxID=985054 RepID=A0A1H3AHS3_9RHOB|nr:hypothetical protein [Ruegeria halocynthiae]SDX29226.1 hypothetical protein SAMN05444358_104181 [Ruegeria halocynthiae]